MTNAQPATSSAGVNISTYVLLKNTEHIIFPFNFNNG
jgi:hypothetical protein